MSGRGEKGSQRLIRELVNGEQRDAFKAAIMTLDPEIRQIDWRSPLAKDGYIEGRNGMLQALTGRKTDFWPSTGPSWDALARVNEDGILLVEAKAHISELKRVDKCKSGSVKNQALIKDALRSAFHALGGTHYDENEWYAKQYQVANRLCYFQKLNELGVPTKLLFVNFVNDLTYKVTELDVWERYYRELWPRMLGQGNAPKGVLVLHYSPDKG